MKLFFFSVFVVIAVLAGTSSGVLSQESQEGESFSAPTTALAQRLDWLIGTWDGEGSSQETTFTSSLSVTPTLDGAALLWTREIHRWI